MTKLEKLSVSCKDAISDRGMRHVGHLTNLTELVLGSDQAEPQVLLTVDATSYLQEEGVYKG